MKKTVVTITVDTEYSTHKDDIGIFGTINGKQYGIPLMVDLLDKYGLKATFYVDVYTNKESYVGALIDTCKELDQRGHDLQLHTHPNGLFDPNRGGMKDYSLQEQIDIIKKGSDIFQEWFSQKPIAHRAGDWGANYDTLKALQENDIRVDSSMFYGWGNCLLNQPELSQNSTVVSDGFVEMPASVFHCIGLGKFAPYRLLSTDGNSLKETKEVCLKLHKSNVGIITTVYHSFSFLRWNQERTKYFTVENRIKKFEGFLKFLSENDSFEVKTVKQVYENYLQDATSLRSNECMPNQGILATANRIVDRYLDRK